MGKTELVKEIMDDMGQYYKAVNTDKMEHLESWDTDDSARLMDHSYIGNEFVRKVEVLITEKGAWYGNRIVWAGDYMDDDLYIFKDNTEKALAEIKDQRGNNLYSYVTENGKKLLPTEPEGQPVDIMVFYDKYPYLVNLDKKQYIDMRYLPEGAYELTINPLPILTCSGNGRGGRDFTRPTSESQRKYIGSWANDRIGLVSKKKLKGYTEIKPDFQEESYHD